MTLQLSAITPKVTVHNGKAITTSQDVADYFGKLHKNVIQKIESLDCSREFMTANFSAVAVKIQAGFNKRDSKAYEMTKDGFVFLVMGFTGKKAAQFKEAYIAEFNRMEVKLHSAPKYHPKAVERFNHSDTRNLTRLVWCMTNGFRFERSWSNALWLALREVTGTPSPERFQVAHIPLIADECRRIYYITESLRQIINDAEKQVIKRLLRKRENIDTVLAEIKQLFEQFQHQQIGIITARTDHWYEGELTHFLERH
ncbi:Rha family transcriptional regulator [Arsenophonus sp. ENCA]|uniref:Rha family transcriptional regulator n=1 Tax=Arsenophonus sp. ENCA TaxID=1987579 RepID=UPI000BCBE386|nr:Rha family transcriptional regulator [Arsenophonus sp. ENCA]PAV02137.1 Rha family transcriptional regulator [Arsenophonus sp. ENCA]